MVKWADLVQRMLAFDDSTPAKQAARKLANMPAFMSVLEINYRATFLKRVLKQRIVNILDRIENDDYPLHEEADPLALHFMRVLSSHTDASDPVVARWAAISEEVRPQTDVVLFLCTLPEGDAQIIDVMHGVINWTLSECNRRKCFCLPYNGGRGSS